jgi:hypothetical protein
MIQHVQAVFLVIIVSLYLSASLLIRKNSKSRKDNELPEEKFAKKPLSSGSAGSHLEQPQCAPKPYRVRLWNGNCSLPVITQMCYGTCGSFTVPRRTGFLRQAEARQGVKKKCHCCSFVKLTTKRYRVPCSIGSARSKTFFLPFAEKCECRACQR